MKLRVQFYAQLRDLIGVRELEVDLSDGATLNRIIAELAVYAPLKVLLEKRLNYVHSTNQQKTAA